MDQNDFYVDLFVNKPAWSTPEPNPDEAARWSKSPHFSNVSCGRRGKTIPSEPCEFLMWDADVDG